MGGSFREKLKRIRKDMQWSQEEAAKKIGTSTAFYNQVEKGKKNPIDGDKLKLFLVAAGRESEFESMSRLAKICRTDFTIDLTSVPEELALFVESLKDEIDNSSKIDAKHFCIGIGIDFDKLKILFNHREKGFTDEDDKATKDATTSS